MKAGIGRPRALRLVCKFELEFEVDHNHHHLQCHLCQCHVVQRQRHLPVTCLLSASLRFLYQTAELTFTQSPTLRTFRDIMQARIDLGYKCTARVSATPLRDDSRVGMCNQDEKGTLRSLRRGVNYCRDFGLAVVGRVGQVVA